MGRPRKWNSDAERMAAKRAEQAAQRPSEAGGVNESASGAHGQQMSPAGLGNEAGTSPPSEDPWTALGRRYGNDEHDRREKAWKARQAAQRTNEPMPGLTREQRVENAIRYQHFLREQGKPPA